MSPSTFEVVRSRSSSQSTVNRIGILSTGIRTAAKISGIVTKLPDGIPRPDAGDQRRQHDHDLVGEAQVEAERLGDEQDGRRLVERGPVVVEVRADAGRQLARSPRDPQPGEGSQRDRDRRGGAGRTERVGHDIQ